MDEEGISMDEFKDAFEKGNMFASGIGKCLLLSTSRPDLTAAAVDYEKSTIVAKLDPTLAPKTSALSLQTLAPGVKVGMRMPSVKVLSQSDARPWHLQELLRSNGTWRLLLFPGDVTLPEPKKRLDALCERLSSPSSLLKRFTPRDARYDSVVEVLTVHAGKRHAVDLFDFAEVLRPYDEVDGWDYGKVFVDDESYHEGHGRLYETFGIGREEGCLVVLRPDQYVSYVGRLEDYEGVDRFFSGFMRERNV